MQTGVNDGEFYIVECLIWFLVPLVPCLIVHDIQLTICFTVYSELIHIQNNLYCTYTMINTANISMVSLMVAQS